MQSSKKNKATASGSVKAQINDNVAFITIFVYVGYLTQTLILNMVNQHSQVYLCLQILHFETQIALRFVPVASAAMHVLLRRAHGTNDKQFVYTARVVFMISKVC